VAVSVAVTNFSPAVSKIVSVTVDGDVKTSRSVVVTVARVTNDVVVVN